MTETAAFVFKVALGVWLAGLAPVVLFAGAMVATARWRARRRRLARRWP